MRYFAQRLVFYAFTAWAAITINFFVPRLTPGDPVTALMAGYQGQMSTSAVHSRSGITRARFRCWIDTKKHSTSIGN